MESIRQNVELFAITHDTQKIFLIIYVGGAAVIALACGLFYFAIWVLAHFILEIYKRVKISTRFSGKDILIALSHCKLDLTFLFVGLCIDVVSHHSIAFAVANPELYMARILRIFKLEGVIRIAEMMPRAFGTIKASSCVAHLSHELAENSHPASSEENFKLKRSDIAALAISSLSIILTVAIPLGMGFTVPEIIHGLLKVFTP
ncbi:MAG: hypothetical protein K6U11_12695 [bacterium]|nr:hypothetical protein [bacterium]